MRILNFNTAVTLMGPELRGLRYLLTYLEFILLLHKVVVIH